MVTTDVVELTRLELQGRLDSAKTQVERNRLGQFATPTVLAMDILEYAKTLWAPHLKVRFLDPAFGTGSFYSALLRVFPPSQVSEAVGYEIDPHYGDKAIELWASTPLKLDMADFTRVAPPVSDEARANLLICNPPYVRHHHLAGDEKLRLQRTTELASGVRLGGLAGLYCYFFCYSHVWMAEGGLAAWLVPSEFMDVNYGLQVKRYLLSRVTLLRIHRFQPHDMQFADALVSSAVVWFRKATPPANHAVEFTYGGTLAEPKVTKQIPVDTLRHAVKWTRFPFASDDGETSCESPRLSDLFTVKRGLATGSNQFFILTPEQVCRYRIPAEFLRPVLPSPRYLPADEVEADATGNPIEIPRLFLLSCAVPENEVEVRYPSLWEYLQLGVRDGVSRGYLCKHRSPWYAQEDRPAAPFLCTYMGRQGTKKGKPFRFILNRSNATAANVYLMLYPKPALQRALDANPTLLKVVWQALREITPETLLSEGRVYGGGLHKIEPNELGNAPADGVLAALPRVGSERVEQLRLLERREPAYHHGDGPSLNRSAATARCSEIIDSVAEVPNKESGDHTAGSD